MILPTQYKMKPPVAARLNRGHPLARGLVGCWLMNEGGGSRVQDASGNGYDGIISAGYAWVSGPDGSAIRGDDTSGHSIVIACPQNSPADVIDGYTVVARANLTSDAGTTLVARKDTAWLWASSSSNTLHARVYSNSSAISVAGGVIFGEWHTYALSYDDQVNHGILYRDAIPIGSVSEYTYDSASSSDPWYIGEDPRDNSGLPLNGDIDLVTIYSRVLSASELASLYRDPYQMFRRPTSPAMMYEIASGAKPWMVYAQQQ